MGRWRDDEEGFVHGNSGGNGGRRTAGRVSVVSSGLEGDQEANACAIVAAFVGGGSGGEGVENGKGSGEYLKGYIAEIAGQKEERLLTVLSHSRRRRSRFVPHETLLVYLR